MKFKCVGGPLDGKMEECEGTHLVGWNWDGHYYFVHMQTDDDVVLRLVWLLGKPNLLRYATGGSM